MQVEVMNISPSVSSDWLKRNIGNRPIRRAWVESWKGIFSRGEYIETHQGVAFSKSGRLLDGQHRLTAISEMPEEFRVRMLVAQGLSEEAFLALDQGGKRSTSDILTESPRLVEVARLLARIYVGTTSGLTPQYLGPFIEFARPYHDELMDFCPTVKRVFGAVSFRTAAVILMSDGVDRDYVKSAYRALVLADFSAMPQSCQVLYRSFLSGGVQASAVIDTLSRAMKVLNPANANLKQIKVLDLNQTLNRVREILESHDVGPKKKAGLLSPAKKSTRSDYRIQGL